MNKNKNLIIGGLLAIVVLMAVGYAAFSTQLTVSNTAKIGSGDSTKTYWDVHIKDIVPGTPVGSATSKSKSVSADGLSATFAVDLVSPGDSITYTVTVENSGKLAAKLNNITFNGGTNPAIINTYSGITKGTTLAAGTTTTFTVTVTYDTNVTSQPASRTSSVTMTLDYVQATA